MIANGLKVLRVLTSTHQNALQIATEFDTCIHSVLKLIEQNPASLPIKEDGSEVIVNLSRYQVLSDDFKQHCKRVLNQELQPNSALSNERDSKVSANKNFNLIPVASRAS